MPARRVQLVSTKSEKKLAIEWMIAKIAQDGSEHHIAAKAVQQFPRIFRQTNPRANREKARNWWLTRNHFQSALASHPNKAMTLSSNH